MSVFAQKPLHECEVVKPEILENKKWSLALEVCKTSLSPEGSNLFNEEQLMRISELENEPTLDAVRNKFQQSKIQQILALGGPEYKYRGRRMLVLQDLWRKLNQWSDNSNIISVDDEVLAVIKEYADKQVNEGLLFCEPERKKITSFSETAFGIDGIILNIELNYKSLMSGLNFDLKKQTMFELIERLEEHDVLILEATVLNSLRIQMKLKLTCRFQITTEFVSDPFWKQSQRSIDLSI